jgi:hypothetical protein
MSEGLDKPGDGAVVGLLYLWRKYTGRKLIRLQVIRDALAAFALSGARLIGAGTFCLIGIHLTFH